MTPVGLGEIRAAAERAADVVLRTPLQPYLNEVPHDNRLWLKAESLQRTGSFKLRGAYNAIASLPDEERTRGVITYSSGNHGQAVACAASMLGIRAVVVMPEDAVPVKVELTRRWGAEIVFAGLSSLDRQQRAMELVAEHGYTVIPPFDDPRIIAGQGTAGIEIAEQLSDVEAVLVPVGGGGLISGVATAVKALRPDVAVVGVEPEDAADARESLRAGAVVTWTQVDTVADGLRTSRLGESNFAAIHRYVDDIITVSEAEILQTVGLLALAARLVTEPSGAVAPAAAIFGRCGMRGRRIVAIISGGNVELARFAACLDLVTEAVATAR